jgi:hypothetical protein
MSSTVKIPWRRGGDNAYMWTETCVRAVELFGLPGDRYTTQVDLDSMFFVFSSEKDAVFFALASDGTMTDHPLRPELEKEYV